MEFKDYYAALGVAKRATQAEIKRAFRKLARRHHPDVNPDDLAAERRFKEVNEAHAVLSDPDKRRKYDELGANWRMYEKAGPTGGAPFSGNAFGGGWPGREAGFHTLSPEEAADIFGGGTPFSDFFQEFFSGGAPPGTDRQRVSRPGPDLEYPITLTLEEVHDGARRRLSIESGQDTRQVDVRIPPGVNDGARVRVAGKGAAGAGGGPAGDLFLRIHQAPHAAFTRRGRDLHLGVKVDVATAVLGGGVAVPKLRGPAVTLRIPAGTQGGQVFRLKGHGLPATDTHAHPGDLYAEVRVRIPEQLTDSQRRHYEALAALDAEPADVASGGS